MADHDAVTHQGFHWPAQVIRDSDYLLRAVGNIGSDPDATPEQMSRRLRSLQNEGCRPIDGELTPGTEVEIVCDMLTNEGNVMVRFWSSREGMYEIDRFPLTCLGPRRRKGSRTRTRPWMEVPWSKPEVMSSTPSV